MKLPLRRWLTNLPPQLRPRGVRYHSASLNHAATLFGKRIFILPTKQGLIFVAVLLVILLGATNYGNSMAFALCFLLGSLMFISVLHTYRNLAGIEVRLAQLLDAFAGGHATFVIELRSAANRPRYDIALSTSHNATALVSVTQQDHALATLAIPAARRGLLQLGRITLESRYPFGLFRTWSYVDIEGEVLVYPRPSAGTAPLHSTASSGDGVATREPGSDDFHGLRSYQHGDSLRHIHWQALARGGELLTKEFQRHQSPELWFEWNSTAGRSIEERLSLLCRWVLDAERHQQHYGMRLPGIEIPPGVGAAQQQRALRQLALFGITR